MGRQPRIGLWLLGIGTLFSSFCTPPAGWSQALQPIPLECRLADGPWRSCQMEVIQVGRHWFVQIGADRFEFTHDGRGKVRLRKDGIWTEVTPRWAEDQSLCWGEVCARGDIPLD
jgi:hypothetical protein